jgi:hypothetical protein
MEHQKLWIHWRRIKPKPGKERTREPSGVPPAPELIQVKALPPSLQSLLQIRCAPTGKSRVTGINPVPAKDTFATSLTAFETDGGNHGRGYSALLPLPHDPKGQLMSHKTSLETPRGRYDEHNSKFSLSMKPKFN